MQLLIGLHCGTGRNDTPSNNFQLDGMPNTKTGGDIAFVPPRDSMQEFRVQTNAYDASIGRQAAVLTRQRSWNSGKLLNLRAFALNVGR